MKLSITALTAALALVLSASSAFAEDAPGAPAAAPVPSAPPAPPAPPPAPAAVVVTGDCCRPTCCQRGWSVWLEPMMLKFHPSVADWAAEGDASQRPIGVIHDVEYDYEFGARAGIAHIAPGCNLGWGVQVTWANAETSQSAVAPTGGTLGLTHSSPDGPDFVADATATHDSEIDYLVVDAGGCYHVCLGRSLDATGFGGLRFAKISSDVTENLFAAGGVLAESLVASTDLVGFGLAAGAEVRWTVCGGFSFYGRAAGGILLSKIEGSVVHATTATTLTSARNDIERITPFIEMGVGVGWGSERFLGSCVGLHVDLGVELTNWFNVLDPLSYVDDVKDSALNESSDDLGISAVTLRVTFTF